MFVVNTPLYDAFDLLDASNAAITGKTTADFTASACLVSNPAATAAVAIAEIGGGAYRTSFTPTTTGVWKGTVVYNAGGVYRMFSGTYDVVTAQQADPMASARGAKIDNLDALAAGVVTLLSAPTLPPTPPGSARRVTLGGVVGFLTVTNGALVFTPAAH